MEGRCKVVLANTNLLSSSDVAVVCGSSRWRSHLEAS